MAVRNFRPAWTRCFLAAFSPRMPREAVIGFSLADQNLSLVQKATSVEEFGVSLADGSKAFAVDGAGAVVAEGFEVLGSGVALVIRETVLGEKVVVFGHEAIAGDLGEDAGGRDGEAFGVAIDDRGLGATDGEDVGPVDEGVVRNEGEFQHGFVHGAEGSLQDVDGVDDFDIDGGDGGTDLAGGGKELEKFFALLFVELLGIVQALEFAWEAFLNPFAGEAHDGGDNRSGERAAAGFVSTGDAGATALEAITFELESAWAHFAPFTRGGRERQRGVFGKVFTRGEYGREEEPMNDSRGNGCKIEGQFGGGKYGRWRWEGWFWRVCGWRVRCRKGNGRIRRLPF